MRSHWSSRNIVRPIRRWAGHGNLSRLAE